MSFSIISNVLNKYWHFMEELGGNYLPPDTIPEAMIHWSRPPRFEGYLGWKPIASTITDEAIDELEKKIGYLLPLSYKFFLQYQHFMDLDLGEYQTRFFSSTPEDSINILFEKMSQFPPSLVEMGFEPPLQRGYIPFADFSDYGVACFDSHSKTSNGNEYKIIWLGHEDGYQEPQPFATNFISMFHDFDKHLDEWIKNRSRE